MEFIKKNISNILFFAFIVFLFTPFGKPVKTLLIKGVSFVTTRVFDLEIDKSERIGLQTYDWQLESLSGDRVDFNQYKGKVVFVNFWATWCPPCIAEMPSLQNLYDEFHQDVVFLFVANDDKERVIKFISDKAYHIPVYYQYTESPPEMPSNSLPTTYIIDMKGKIVVNKVGAADWDSGKVKNLLKELISGI